MAFLFCLFLYFVRIGINVWENVFSVKIRRNKLGSLKATKKASVVIFALKILAIIAFRAKLSIRENMVIELTAVSDFNKFIGVLI